MGLREKFKSKVKQTLSRFSGEFSSKAPEHIEPFERNLPEDPEREVVKARLNRPTGRD